MLNENRSRIVRWYKGRTTFEVRKIHADFAWQTRFHDHIIRNETDYQNIAEYIVANPSRWLEDKFYTALIPISD
jgi:putative transposase